MIAFIAAWLNFRLFSAASFSLRALVFELPLGATPVRIFLESSGVKFTNPTDARPVLWVEEFEDLRRWCVVVVRVDECLRRVNCG